jgi:hypothetical protein
MDRCLRRLLPALVVLLLSACGGGKGSSAPAPANFTAAAGDQSITMTWAAQAGVDYWIFVGPPGTTADNFVTTSGAYVFAHVTSPYSVASLVFNNLSSALVNGKEYDVSINARINGGPGGPSSAPIRVLPRAAGTSWTAAGTLINASDNIADDLLAADDGLPLYYNGSVLTYTGNPASFVFTGRAGAAFYGTLNADGLSYTFHSVASGVPTADLNALAYAGGIGFLAAGSNGSASLSLDGITWTPQSTGAASSKTFRALASTSATSYIAVGDACTVYGVANGGTAGQTTVWTDYSLGFSNSAAYSGACSGGTPPALNAATYGTIGGAGYYAAVGSQGVVAYSSAYGTTSANWTAATVSLPTGVSAANVTLRGLNYGVFYATANVQSNGTQTATPLWVAVGDYLDSGNNVVPLILYSTTLSSWTAATLPTLPAGFGGHLRAIRASHDPINGGLTQLVAVGDNGLVLSSPLVSTTGSGSTLSTTITNTPAQTWTAASYSPANLNALASGHFGFQAAGSGGASLYTY